MLLDLPRGVLEYIVSIVIYDKYEGAYASKIGKDDDVRQNVMRMDRYLFVSTYHNSSMSRLMRDLGLIHPQILQMLKHATKTEKRQTAVNGRVWTGWKFRQNFFHTLTSH